MTTTATKTHCEVLDQIVDWTKPDGSLNVQVGDLILEDGRFEQVSFLRQAAGTKFSIHYKLDGEPFVRDAAPDGLVAVRRYVETTEE